MSANCYVSVIVYCLLANVARLLLASLSFLSVGTAKDTVCLFLHTQTVICSILVLT